ITVDVMDLIYTDKDYVTGISQEFGSSGDRSPVTAYRIYKGTKAAAKEAFGTDSLTGRKIAVQGVGNVAYTLCGHFHKEGAKLVVTDINKQAVQRAVDAYGAEAVDPDDIHTVDCDIYSPCALGADINDD